MKLKVGVRDYDIKFRTEIVEVGGEFYGKHDDKEMEITLAYKFSQIQQNETFLHEMFHAIAVMQDLQEINNNEHWIDLLSKGLHMVIKDNPHIFTMIDIKQSIEEYEKRSK